MKSKKVHPSIHPFIHHQQQQQQDEMSVDQKWFLYDGATDDVTIDVESLDNAAKNNKKNKFEMFLAKIKDDEWSEEEEEEGENDRDDDEELLLKTPHGVLLRPDPQRPSLLLWDLLLFLLDFLQMYSLLQSMSLRWIWPKAWIDATSWIFLFNVDLWDLTKVHSNVTYQNARDFLSTSSQFPVHYIVWVLFWLFVVFIVIVGVIGGRKCTKRRRVKLPYLKRAWIEQAAIVLIQVLALPLGMAMARLFQCRPNDWVVDSINELICWRGFHWLLAFFFFPIYAFVFVACPVWMVVVIRKQVFSYAPQDHETFIRLKETEYANGVDILWAVSRLYLFSSFRRRAIYFRPFILIVKFLLVIAASALFGDVFTQALFCSLLLFFVSASVLILRPHRIPLFNVFLFVNFLFLSIDALIGTLLAKFGVWNNMSALFTLEYAKYELLIVNFCWLLIATPIVVYVILRRFSWCGVKRKPMWPTLTEDSVEKLDEQTKIYTKEVIKARLLLDRSMAMPASFIPIHELANEIHVVNAFCREAEIRRHPLQQTLWDVLDDLIEAHNSAAASSLFAGSVKPSIRKTAAEFLDMMPALTRRLAQRDYDFILVKPKRKKLLLKLYVLGTFLRLFEKVAKKRKTTIAERKKTIAERKITAAERKTTIAGPKTKEETPDDDKELASTTKPFNSQSTSLVQRIELGDDTGESIA